MYCHYLSAICLLVNRYKRSYWFNTNWSSVEKSIPTVLWYAARCVSDEKSIPALLYSDTTMQINSPLENQCMTVFELITTWGLLGRGTSHLKNRSKCLRRLLEWSKSSRVSDTVRVQLDAIICHYMPLYAIIRHYMPLYAVLCHYMPLYAIICHYTPLYANICHYMPFYAIIRQYTPLYAIICHYTPLDSIRLHYTP